MGRLFGTDGVRGVANTELTCGLAFSLGQAGAYVLAEENPRPRIVVARDTRVSGDMLEAALVAGICSVGGEALCVGVMPTPSVAYLTRLYGADAGVVISASHNPMEYNGIKFFNRDGYKLPDELEDRIESIILDQTRQIPMCAGDAVGRRVVVQNAAEDYVNFLKSTVPIDLKGYKIAVDCANGAAYRVAPLLLSQLGAEMICFFNDPDGTNINRNCGSTHPKALQDYVLENEVDLGLAFDGDADRLIAVDENGVLVDGDKIMAICGIDMHERGTLKKDTVVATIMSNIGLEIALKNAGCRVVRTAVGDRYVLEKMLQEDYSLGGEQSGHVIFLDHNTTGDGLITALQLLSVMVRKKKSLAQLSTVMKQFPQVLVNAKVSNDKKEVYLQCGAIAEEINRIEKKFNSMGRVVIRPSGTEPLVRVMIEGPDIDELEQEATRLAAIIEEYLA
ncbi:phosphoglucosamine mutase [Mahella australiensis]|uniref:Phosphoglucosamine mutase n=1 Tax=Mahella australiensis (strain DSM 15567 / CIP 107919 / 50-1 BON) TaxID=697281 RepID=F4A0J2_MAHA5|nr:phosphoglucosamine mutase [Mahella australiensis]AEE95871.1 phosphoglucosamine mutase [Mahella australiensis 50-1 BON]